MHQPRFSLLGKRIFDKPGVPGKVSVFLRHPVSVDNVLDLQVGKFNRRLNADVK